MLAFQTSRFNEKEPVTIYLLCILRFLG